LFLKSCKVNYTSKQQIQITSSRTRSY